MADLTNNTYRDILGMLDYFMTDRASDSDVMLDELGIEEERRLKMQRARIVSGRLCSR